MTADRAYLQSHRIPQLFEGLMTGVIFNKPPDPIDFLEKALQFIKAHPDDNVKWDMFLKNISTEDRQTITRNRTSHAEAKENKGAESAQKRKSRGETTRSSSTSRMGLVRTPSVIKAAQVAEIPSVPIILFMGGPGGGKTRHAAKVALALQDKGLVHICMPDIIRQALSRYKDKYPEWREAHDHYSRGELIPNHLALALVKAEMGRHKDATAFFLEGFPREARQVEDFERQVKSVNMAMIIDYDEKTLRDHMEKRGLGMEIIDQKIKEFKQKTLPSAKYFDDQKLLHLIPGERDDQAIYERMKTLVSQAMESGLPMINSAPPHEEVAKTLDVPQSQATISRFDLLNPPPQVIRGRGHLREIFPNHSGSSSPTSPVSTPPKTPPKTPETHEEKDDHLEHSSVDHSPEVSVVAPASEEAPRPPSTHSVKSTKPETPPTPASVLPSRPPSTHSKKSISSQSNGNKKATPTPPKTGSAEKRGSTASYSNGLADVPRGLPNNAPVILLIGAPGALKNEIAKRVAQKYDGFVLVSMGDLLRKNVTEAPNDELWTKVSKKLNEGEPIPTKLCRQILYPEIHSLGQSAWGYVIEGYPRTIAQLDDFELVVGRVDVAILIDCTEQFCEEMVRKRFEEQRRPDDSSEVFKVRLASFKQNTLPMLKDLDDKGRLRVVDGDGNADNVFKEVAQVIDTALFIEEDDGSGGSLGESKKGSLSGPTQA